MTTQASRGRLGGAFWLLQSGQMISTVGDACGTVALAWWILETKSAGTIAAVLAPAMAVKALLTPLLGPLGDRYSRKRLILISDLARAMTTGVLAALVTYGTFDLWLVVGVQAVTSVASALFSSSNMSIVPQLVSTPLLATAVRMSQSLQAIGRVLGGVVAGLLVTWLGVGVALTVDAVSFAVAAVATAAIRRDTAQPVGREDVFRTSSFVRDLRRGFQVVLRVPVLFWLCVAIAFFNVVLGPMHVLLPTYAKETKGMPAWFLGGLESCLGLGIIVGAVGIGVLERRLRVVSSVLVGLVFLGGATAVLSHVPGVLLPLLMMFVVGIGAAWTNIPIGTRISVAVPDQFRSRISSIVGFIFETTQPIGVAAGGVLVAAIGVRPAMTGLGIAMLLALPSLFWMPGVADFFRRPVAELTDYFSKGHPGVFAANNRGAADRRT